VIRRGPARGPTYVEVPVCDEPAGVYEASPQAHGRARVLKG